MTVIDNARTFHVGIRVPELAAAMDELGAQLSVTWCAVQEREQLLWSPETGAITTPLRFTYSAEGPIHLELLQGAAGTVWDASAGAGLHHTGVWAADVNAGTQALLDAGWSLVGAQAAPEDGFGVYSYVQAPSGLIVELVAEGLRPMFERWWAGGSLG